MDGSLLGLLSSLDWLTSYPPLAVTRQIAIQNFSKHDRSYIGLFSCPPGTPFLHTHRDDAPLHLVIRFPAPWRLNCVCAYLLHLSGGRTVIRRPPFDPKTAPSAPRPRTGR